ncbi:MAG: enoyl-CoA hydratase/isomerase family protein [Pseudomonadales bacterium]
MHNEKIITTIDSRGVATVTLNNPEKHNAFDDTVITSLTSTFATLASNDDIRVVILAANGKSFSAGADLNWMKRTAGYSVAQNLQDAKALTTLFYTLNSLAKPTIARVQGAAFGGGVGLISCCDIAVASDRASFSLSEVKLGVVPATISPYVIEAIGARAARRYFTTAERFTATTALQIGLISECVTERQLDATIDTIIDALLTNAPKAIATAKQLIADISHRPIDKKLIDETSALIAKLRNTDEGREGLSAFLEKRPASWIKSRE